MSPQRDQCAHALSAIPGGWGGIRMSHTISLQSDKDQESVCNFFSSLCGSWTWGPNPTWRLRTVIGFDSSLNVRPEHLAANSTSGFSLQGFDGPSEWTSLLKIKVGLYLSPALVSHHTSNHLPSEPLRLSRGHHDPRLGRELPTPLSVSPLWLLQFTVSGQPVQVKYSKVASPLKSLQNLKSTVTYETL